MEIFDRLFGTPRAKTGEVPSLKEGHLMVDMGGQGTEKGTEKVIVPSEAPIWIISGHINGEIPGTVIGLIETIHDPITLVIGDPAKYLVTGVGPNLSRDEKFSYGTAGKRKTFEFWTNGEKSGEEESLHHLNRSRQDAITELHQSEKRMTALTEQLTRLQVGQNAQALKMLEDLQKKEKQLEGTVKFREEQQDKEERKLDSIIQSAAKQLTIRSLNGDITLTIQDPSLEVVISDEFNHRGGKESVVVRGKPPLNPTRKASVFTYRGKISVNYPDTAA